MELPQFRFGQEDLRARSLEPLLVEREYYPLNGLYGSAEILREYAGLPRDAPIPWAVQSIIGFDDFPASDCPAVRERELGVMRRLADANLPWFLTIDAGRGRLLRQRVTGEVQVIGSMFHYARELYLRSGFDTPVPRRGTIALPDKSDLGKLLDFDRGAYAEKLVSLPEEFQPVYVSMHWRDFDRGCHEPYLRAGLRVVCSGHPYEPVFYQRLYDVCRQFRYSCSNEISTSFVLSVLSGCQFFFLDGGPVTIERTFKNTTYHGREPTLDEPAKAACIEAPPFPPVAGGWTRQRELAGIASGEAHVKPPEFFQQYWEPARDALSDRLTTRPFTMNPPPVPYEFANWLPAGFDGDGWADSDCSLEVPARAGFVGIDLELSFPFFKKEETLLMLTIRLDGDSATERSIPVDRNKKGVFVPLRDDGARRKIELRGPPGTPLPGEFRVRSFRLTKIEWRAEPVSHPADGTEAARPGGAPGRRGKWRDRLFRILERWKRKP